MTLRWHLTEDDVHEIVRTVLVEEGHCCDHLPDDGPELVVDVDDVATIIARKLVAG